MSKSVQLLASLALSLISFSAAAYHLKDHAKIATQAYREFAGCFPTAGARLHVKALVQADLEEDLDIIDKLFMYSHFFNPNKELHMWRKGSAERVASLEPTLLQCRAPDASWNEDKILALGRLIHHFQDMTVPAHVVPVHHSAWDGFERYELRGEISSGWSCAEIAAAGQDELGEVLKQTALETLAAVRNLRIQGVSVRNRAPQVYEGADFWSEANGDGFGHYGKLGNFFGTSSFVTRDGSVEIADAEFQQFKAQQMQAAVRATLRALMWAFPQQPGKQLLSH
jgi:hypothetical protein